MSTKKELLDPIGAMCRLVALNFRPKHTKIGITDHAIEIQQPTSSQWLHRYMNGDDRDNISALYPVITRIIEWYLIPLYDAKHKKKRAIPKTPIIYNNSATKENTSEKDITDDKVVISENELTHLIVSELEVTDFWACMSKLSRYMCCGLSKLQETYELGNVVYSIQYYINLVFDALEGRYSLERLPKCITSSELTNLLDYNKIKNLWNYKKVYEICELYDKCFEAQSDNTLSDNHKKDKIEGYLKAVDHLLNISDEEFRKLLNGSKQG